MAMVRDWFLDFARSLVERSGRTDFPEAGSGYWDDFEAEFVRLGVHWTEADSACSRVCNLPGLFIPDYRPMIVAEVKKVQREMSAGPNLDIALEDARLASRDCPDCLGNGSAVRYVHPEIFGKLKTAAGNPVPVGGSVSIPCSCPLGRHVARGLAPEGRPPGPTVDKYPTLRRWAAPWGSPSEDGLDNQFRYRPSDWDEVRGCPIPTEVYDLATLKALTMAGKLPGIAATRRSQLAAIDRASRPEVSPQAKPEPRPISIPEDRAVDGWY